mgnify:CR=1 FL=1
MPYVDVSTLKTVTIRVYPFTERERSEGVFLSPNSAPFEFWSLISQHGNVRDPTTNRWFGTMEEEKQKLVDAYDAEMLSFVAYIGLTDKLQCLVDQGSACFDHEMLLAEIGEAHLAWQAAEQVATQQMRAWEILKADRRERIEEALGLKYTEQDQEVRFPSFEVLAELQEELDNLRLPTKLSKWYQAHEYMMEQSGRPYFGPGELNIVSMKAKAYPFWRCPFKMSPYERLGRVCGKFGWVC